MNTNEYIIIHHSTTVDGRTYDAENIKWYHINIKKWSDVAYHFFTELIGSEIKIVHGRSIYKDGAHTLGFNDRSIGVCLVGDFDAYAPSLKTLLVTVKLIRSLQMIYGVPTNKVIGHRETYALLHKKEEKTCPGSRFSMVDLREALRYGCEG